MNSIKKILMALILLLSINVSAQDSAYVWAEETGRDIGQFAELRIQLEEAMGTLPPTVRRVALHKLRFDREEFSASLVRYLQNMVEEVMARQGMKSVISSPELRTTRIIVTDTTFFLANALPNAEALWELGRKLRVEAFVEGSVTRSAEGDVILSLKIIRQETAEIIWNRNFVAGPNRSKAKHFSFEPFLHMGFNLWPLAKYESSTDSVSRSSGMSIYRYYAEFGAQEAITESRRFFMSVVVGIGAHVPVLDDPDDSDFNTIGTKLHAQAGFDLLAVLIRKNSQDRGYALGMYLGSRAIFPNNLMTLQHGYSTRPSDHFGASVGVNWFPLAPRISSSFTSLGTDGTMYMEGVAYEARIAYYF
jgi:TolB-like protein